MGDKYIDLVICDLDDEPMPMVFRAPAWSHLKKGDYVSVETDHGQQAAIVDRCITINKSTEELDFILVASGINTPLKRVLSQIKYIDFDYEDDSD
jgi:hypothetical protein